MPWLITDIDGTITDADGRLHLPAVEGIQRLEKAGVLVGLISGRPYSIVRMLGEYLGLSGPLIAENGGVGFFCGHHFVIGSRRAADEAVEALRGLIPLEPTWDNQCRQTDYALDGGVNVEELKRLLIEKCIQAELQVSSIMVHLAKKGVTKRAGLEYCLKMAGVTTDEVVVAGDSDSDISLFEGFQASLAPANCTEGVRRLAHYRADLAFGEGFCEGIEYFRRMGKLP